jgi:hypothetical protein
MGKTITLEVSDTLFERAEKMAVQVGVPVEVILAKWLERGTMWDTSAEYPVYTPFGTDHLAEPLQKFLKEVSSKHNKE